MKGMLHESIQKLRINYKSKTEIFDTCDLVSMNPIKQFKAWFDDALKCPEIVEPNAMALATATRDGVPSVRFVLLKEVDENGFQFFTNSLSKKGNQLTENPFASAVFYWFALHRQIRIEGKTSLLNQEVIDNYFNLRPKESRIAALVSECQSSVISNRKFLDDHNDELLEKYSNVDIIPRPEYWVGYNISPISVEFWQGQTNRLHDRILFRLKKEGEIINEDVTMKGDGDWLLERLSP